MPEDTDRPQDAGRRHGRKGRPSPETLSLLERYQASMRSELGALLDELEPRPADPGLGLVSPESKRLELRERAGRWDLAIKLGRELGTAVDPGPTPGASLGPPRRRSGRVDYG